MESRQDKSIGGEVMIFSAASAVANSSGSGSGKPAPGSVQLGPDIPACHGFAISSISTLRGTKIQNTLLSCFGVGECAGNKTLVCLAPDQLWTSTSARVATTALQEFALMAAHSRLMRWPRDKQPNERACFSG